MKAIPNDLVLRPRFQLNLPQSKEGLLASFEKATEKTFVVKL